MESKLEDLQRANPELNLEPLSTLKPKYLDWAVKQLKQGARTEDLTPTLQFFDKNVQRFTEKDVNKYKSLKDLEDQVKALGQSKQSQKRQLKAEGAEKLVEDERYILLYIKNKDAAICYGANTKWCITMSDASFFEQYTGNNVVFYYLIDKTKNPDDPRSKIAYAVQRDEDNKVIEIEAFDALDEQIKPKLYLDIIKNDAPQRPMGILFKLKLGLTTEAETQALMNDPDPNVRLEVVRRIDPKYLPQMMDDKDSEIRYQAAKRIDPQYLPQMLNDEDDYVRCQVAQRIDPKHLPQMMHDESSDVRYQVATSISPQYLPQMMKDTSAGIRYYVAQRIDLKYLPQMMNDPDPNVRTIVVQKIDPNYLPQMMNDTNAAVRKEIAARIDPKYLPRMMNDSNEYVRQQALRRLKHSS